MLSTLANNLRKRVTQALTGKQPSYRLFDVQLKQRIALSPSLTRLVFTGPDVDEMTTLAPDQRIKLLFPAADGSLPNLSNDLHWKAAHSALPPAQRPPMRTYTIRALRREALEVDVDFVLHGVNSPASAWATHAQVGDGLQMVAPNLAYEGDPGGYEWKPPQGMRNVLLVGDETALPAIAGILEQLADNQPGLTVQAFIEVPLEADCLPMRHGSATHLHWLPRELLNCKQGEAMQHAVRELASLPQGQATRRVKLEDVDIDTRILWEQASSADSAFHAWVAGESATVMDIRRYLIKERGLPRECLTLMGYWRAGRTFD
ncbi:MAG: siderophore-interacting protein [Candidatus Pseudomonas phytovorans]|uniref:Siderophore-interacting protein n=1 Tax=Candidatus Pseudomonas phytovorans TaxID=3121377 RepID=A0AAJ5WL37_9PSED|nr:siderophore-interacting protein [Pseudomonas sp.]WEK32622.1 MAG: siderophore-interacting protein [Pseudomonas sp.]